MNVLIVNYGVWDDKTAGGNTLSNLFGNWENVSFSQIYSRKSLPSNSVCKKYYTIPETDIVRCLVKNQSIGYYVDVPDNDQVLVNDASIPKNMNWLEKIILKFKIVKIASLFAEITDLFWKSRSWNNDSFKAFIIDNDPDIIFAYGIYYTRLFNILKAILAIKKSNVVLFLPDTISPKLDNRKFFISLHNRRERKHLEDCISLASVRYAITPIMCAEYQARFGKNFRLLRKGCDLSSTRIKNTIGNPLKIVYAGNLYYGRDLSLISLISSLDVINIENNKQVFELEIYSNSMVSKRFKSYIANSSCARIFNVKPYSEIMKILIESDLVLHIESFRKEAIKYTRLSFSTKITDCMQSGSCLLAIGPDNVASMEEISHIPGAISITDIDDLQQTLEDIAQNPSQLIQRANMLQKYALQNFSVKRVRESLHSDFQRLILNDKDTFKERT